MDISSALKVADTAKNAANTAKNIASAAKSAASGNLLGTFSKFNPGLAFPSLEKMLAAFASAFTQGNRLFKLQIGDGKVYGDRLLPQSVEGVESLSACYRYEVTCLSPDAFIPLSGLLGLCAQLDVITGAGGGIGPIADDSQDVTRCGLITDVKTLPSDGGFARYKLIIEAPLALLRYRRTSRVFQDISVPEIVRQILSEHIEANSAIGVALDVKLDLVRQYAPRSYCLQYRESDLAFIERLLFEEGLPYRFEHKGGEAPAVTFIVFDDPWGLPQTKQESVRFHRVSATEAQDSLTEWNEFLRIGPVSSSLSCYEYKCVQVHEVSEETGIGKGEERIEIPAESSLECFDPQTHYYGTDANDLDRYASRRQEALDREKGGYSAQGNVRQLQAGLWFVLNGHPSFDQASAPEEREFVACALKFSAHNNVSEGLKQASPLPFLKQGSQKPGEAEEPPYWVEIEARKRGTPLTPTYAHTRHAKPTAPGLQTATVTGPENEREVYTDAMGRIKIQFHWQRPKEHPAFGADFDENSSCWVRVQHQSAGAAWGHQFIPRIGQEVSVDFFEGDIDRPVVTGVQYNGRHQNPWFSEAGLLPANRTLSGIKSKEHHGQQYGELLFDDTTEQVRVKLSSEHGKTQLNQGYLTHPRRDGEGEPRGEGFELRSDLSGAIRAARGVLISAHGRGMAAGYQLDRAELIAQLETALEIAKALAKDSEANEAETTNTDPQKRLTDYVKNWEDGTNVGKADLSEGKSIAALTAPEGVAVASEANILVASGASQDFVASQDANHTVGQKLRMRVGDALSIFARQTMKIIAALGKIRIAALSNEIEIAAQKKLHLISLEEIVLDAPKITLRAQGAGVEYGGGITSKTTGAHVAHAASHSAPGPASVSPEGALKASQVDYDQKLQLLWQGSGEPIKNRQYRLLLEDGRILTGTTDAEGNAEQLQSEISFARFKLDLLPEATAAVKAVEIPSQNAEDSEDEYEYSYTIENVDGTPVESVVYRIDANGVKLCEGMLGSDGKTLTFPISEEGELTFWMEES
ncbi:MAG: type VI secretion system tip protein VgrG [Proteobacteria bacterium]|nr:type VI secretion system tip protein VgrG [Pseudomonadota bacterium]